MEKIDFVLPWVDSSDPKWQRSRDQYKYGKDHHDANAEARFRDMETLKYALRAIEVHCPWYHRIHLITEGHAPSWLDLSHEKITLVTHEELFIDSSHLPVFNSSAIEMNLVNLKGLTEKFIYMNDDFIIFNPVEQTRFFQKGKPVDFFSHHSLPRGRFYEILKGRDTWIHSLNNNLALLNRMFAPIKPRKHSLFHHTYSFADKAHNFLLRYLFQRLIWINHWHHPQPMLKQTLHNVYNAFSDAMMQCSQNRFRSEQDLTQYIYRYWQLIKGDFYPHKHNDGLVANLDSLNILMEMIEELETNRDIHFVCFNDSVDLPDKEYQQVKETLLSFLKKHFPDKASFER
jgi:hypothetical protein